MTSRSRRPSLERWRSSQEHGAAAVEMALMLLFVLFPLILGIIEFGFAFNAQISLTQATREAVRVGALNVEDATMEGRLQEAYSAVRGGTPVPEIVEGCEPDDTVNDAEVRARIDYEPIIGVRWFGEGIPLRAVAVMRCGG